MVQQWRRSPSLFWWLTRFYPPQRLAQGIPFDPNRFFARPFFLGIAFRRDQRLPPCRCTQPRIPPPALETRIRWARPLSQRLEVLHQVGSKFLGALPPTCPVRIQPGPPAVHFMPPVANRIARPSSFAVGLRLTALAHHLHPAGHEDSPFMPFQALGRGAVPVSLLIRPFDWLILHTFPSLYLLPAFFSGTPLMLAPSDDNDTKSLEKFRPTFHFVGANR